MSIIKRKKQDKFFIMNNKAVQEDLTSLSSIGLLSYIISLPSDFKLYKTYLQKKFTRRTVDGAFKELVEKKYIAGFSAYVDRKKQYYYIASDEPLNQEEYNNFISETINEIEEDLKLTPKNLQPIADNQFNIFEKTRENPVISSDVQSVQHSNSTNAHFVQHKEYSTLSAVPNEQVQINTNKVPNNKINNNKENNTVNILKGYKYNDENFRETSRLILDSLYVKYNEGIFTKEEWTSIGNKLIFEMIRNKLVCSDLYAYIESSIKTICSRRKKKLGIEPKITAKTPVNFYNWLEG